MAGTRPTGPVWRKSSLSGSGQCVEVSLHASGDVLVRQSKDPEGPVLRYTASEWAAFVGGVKAGEFDVGGD